MRAILPFDQRPSGIPSAGELPWGSRFCVFYASKTELLEVLIPFIKAGLECNELCSWEVRAPLTPEEVRRALAAALPEFARHISLGQLEIISGSDPAMPAEMDEALERQLDRAILTGFDGLRLVRHAEAGTTAPIPPGGERLRRLNIIGAFLYARADLDAVALMRVVQDHRFALIHNFGRWELLEGSAARAAGDALERTEEKLQSLFTNMTEGFAYHRIVLDPGGRPCDYVFLEVNPAFERLTGLFAQHILGQRVTQVLPGIETDPIDWIGKYGRVALTGEPVQFESYAAPLDRWYAVSAFSPHKGYFAVTFSDITDRKRAEAERQHAEEERERLLREVSAAQKQAKEDLDAMTTLQRLGALSLHEGNLRAVLDEIVKAAAAISGADSGDIHILGATSSDRKMAAQSGPGIPVELEHGKSAVHISLISRAGKPLGVLSTYYRTPGKPDDRSLRFLDLLGRQAADIIERAQAGEALRSANVQLLEADRRKNQFLAVLSHELRNPLSPIKHSLFVLDRAIPGGDLAHRARQVIERQTDQLVRLVDDLLDVTRITRNKIQLQRQRLELNELLRRTIDDHRSLFDKSEVGLELTTWPEPVYINADWNRLAQVVGNLLQNAAKFTGRRGTTRVSVAADQAEHKAVIRVADTGIGMTPQMLARLFEPFSQADDTLERSKGGLGLGLALAKGLVELHDGKISAHSEGVGKGAQFIVTLPLDDTAHVRVEAGSTAGARRPRRVLVIEDNMDAADTLRDALQLYGHEVAVAYSGPDGIVKAREFKPDVVLCDIGLPGMDGYEVARTFRADATMATARLVALSGYALPEDVQRAREAGFNEHLAKPPGLQALQELLGSPESGASLQQ